MRRYFIIIVALGLFFGAAPAHAALNCPSLPADTSAQEIESDWINVAIGIPGVTTPCTDSAGVTRDYIQDMGAYIAGLYKFFAGAIGIIATAMVFYGGIKWVAAAGNASRIKDAKETIFSALIAVGITLGSYLLLYMINPNLVNLRPPALTVVDAIYQRFGELCPTDKYCLSGADEGKKCASKADCAGATEGICDFPYDLRGDAYAKCGTMYTFKAVQGLANAGEQCLGGGCTGDGLCRSAALPSQVATQNDAKCIGASGMCTSQQTGCEQWSLPGFGACKGYLLKLDGAGKTGPACGWFPQLKCPTDTVQVGCGECNDANIACGVSGTRPGACTVTATTTPVYRSGPYQPEGEPAPAICCKATAPPGTLTCKI